MDPLATETSEFWKNHGEFNDVDAKIQTEVFRLPTTCFAEENGALVSSARLQWHWKGAEPPGEARSDSRSCRSCSCACARCTRRTAASSRTRS
jgi:formate dehydrogenase major subunit